MIQHYLKIAYRNLLKYKSQSVISILGLAAGFACFSLSTFWIHYETTYDAFHKDAERIYLVRTDDSHFGSHYSNHVPFALGSYLKNSYPEIEDYCIHNNSSFFILKNNKMEELSIISPDTTFMRMMNVKLQEGTSNFLLSEKETDELAITLSAALSLFGTTDVIGKTLTDQNYGKEHRIGAIVSDWGSHSTMKYQLMGKVNLKTNWDDHWYKLLIKVKEGTDTDALLARMNRQFPKEMQENKYYPNTGLTRFYLEPLTALRYAQDYVRPEERNVHLRYIVYFSLTGLLIVVCTLINYLTVFIDRIRSRQREFALRKVNGASERSLLVLLGIDFLTTLALSLGFGMMLIELLLPSFTRYSMIDSSGTHIYQQCLSYILLVSALAFCTALALIRFFRRHSLQHLLSRSQGNKTERWFRKGCIIMQLAISLSFVFCTVVMQKQLYHLRNVNIGLEYRHRGAMSIWMNVDMNVWAEKIKSLPMVTEVVEPKYGPLIGQGASTSVSIDSWDGLEGKLEKPISMDEILAGEEFFKFYDMKLIAGKWIDRNSDIRDVNVMESTVRRMGWTPEEALGKHIYYCNREVVPMTIVGVVKDCAYKSPGADIPHTAFINTYKSQWMWGRCFVLFKYQPGSWEECRQAVEEMQQKELPDRKLFLYSEEEEFNKYLQSEKVLSQLLNFASAVCILISIFGIYSLITLSCEQRRKEIAIRKVNGATMRTILLAFSKEYLLLLAGSAMIAFPLSYFVMKRWIETYNRQTDIGIFPFLTIFAGGIAIIGLSIGWRVWRAANENPAEVIKSE